MHVCIGIGIMIAFISALELWLSRYDPTYGSNPHTPEQRSDPKN
jgi:hypothetical protein